MVKNHFWGLGQNHYNFKKGGYGEMITVLHRGGYAQMITILHRGGGALGTPKSDYVICARTLKYILYVKYTLKHTYYALREINILRVRQLTSQSGKTSAYIYAFDTLLQWRLGKGAWQVLIPSKYKYKWNKHEKVRNVHNISFP